MSGWKKTADALRVVIKILLPLCLVAAGIAGFRYYKSKEVKMERKPVEKHAMVVDTLTVSPERHNTTIRAMGTVGPEKQVVLKSQVSGRIVKVAPGFVQGGLVKKGDPLLWLEDADYRLAVDKAKSSLDKALADFEIEKGQQFIAREELRLLSQVSPEGVSDTALALRKPQLEQARASVAEAKSDLASARLDLARTTVTAPFNALILEKHVDLGSTAAVQGDLATLVDVNRYQIEIQVPLDRLEYIDMDETGGSPAVIHSLYAGHRWEGRVVRTTGRVTGQSRMAGVIIRVTDPLGLEAGAHRPRLLLDDHVEAVITGRPLENVYALPRSLVRENNTLWIYNDGGLKIREAAPVWTETDKIFIRTGLNPGDRVISSEIPVPVPGMALTLGDRS